MSNRILNFSALFIVVVLSMYLLAMGRGLLLPLVVAVVLWFFIQSLSNGLRSFSIVKRIVPEWLVIVFSILMTYAVLHVVFSLLATSAISIFQDVHLYQLKLTWVLDRINEKTNLQLSYDTLFKHINVRTVLSQAALGFTSVIQNFFIILIYLLFLLSETNTFDTKIKAMSKGEAQYEKLKKLLGNVKSDINDYIRIKTFVSFLTGLLSYVVLISFGVKNAEFWGILIFLLNFIPTIGSIIAVALTLLAVSIQFTALLPFVGMGVALIVIQIAMGNILEPKLTGNTLNLSPLIILLSLGFWGQIWGVIGMLLCVPLMTIINIVLGQFESTRNFAILMSASGELKSHS